MDVSVNVFFPETPAFAELAPHRGVYVGDADGRCEIFSWDTESGASRQLTDRAQGTVTCAIEPDGQQVWWFDNEFNGIGSWRVQPFDGSAAAQPAGLPAGRPAGLAMALDGTVVAGISDERGLAVYRRRPGRPIELLRKQEDYGQLVDVSSSAGLVVLAGEPDAPNAVVVIYAETGSVTELAGSPHRLWAAGFAPAGADRLLLAVQTLTGYRLAIWTPEDGLSVLEWCEFDTEIAVSWYPDGQRVLVRQDRHARSVLQVADLTARRLTALETPPGSILAAAVQPDGDLHYVWTDSTRPPRLLTGSGLRLPGAHGVEDRHPGRREDVWVPTEHGRVHALVAVPESPGPHPGVFLLHGGPFEAAMDAYDPMVSVFLSIGCAVIRPNYRGSTGYGQAWRQDFGDGVGLTQLADIAAVLRYLTDDGILRAGQVAVCGQSWGGYLALLAAGVQPELWRAVAAVNPIADYAAAFGRSTAAVRALDTALFGGTPDELPQAYARSSPSSYLEQVRAPVLLVAGTDDPKCPPEQVQSYANRLRELGVEMELSWTKSGHEGYEVDVLVETLGAVVKFVATALGGRPEPATSGAR
ncbi:MAG: hypothetical protein QOE23_2156 [Pseudonocardiales bacterium]|nr:hypothetical protein [Pseudonocardiales bacterium]